MLGQLTSPAYFLTSLALHLDKCTFFLNVVQEHIRVGKSYHAAFDNAFDALLRALLQVLMVIFILIHLCADGAGEAEELKLLTK